MRRPRGYAPNRLLGLAARALLLFGGVTLAIRLGMPQPAGPAPGAIDADSSGRGAPSTPPTPQAQTEGHETEDMVGGVLARLVLLLFVVALVVAFGMVELGGLFERMQDDASPPLTAQQTMRVAPPAPNLQNDPVGDLARLRDGEAKLLGGYAWADERHTRARIPIERAMSLVAGKSLDVSP